MRNSICYKNKQVAGSRGLWWGYRELQYPNTMRKRLSLNLKTMYYPVMMWSRGALIRPETIFTSTFASIKNLRELWYFVNFWISSICWRKFTGRMNFYRANSWRLASNSGKMISVVAWTFWIQFFRKSPNAISTSTVSRDPFNDTMLCVSWHWTLCMRRSMWFYGFGSA